jgi:excisionase family DNA binding protein
VTKLLTVQQLADYLNIDKRTIYRLLKRSDIPAVKVGHGWRFDKARIDEWLRKNTIGIQARILVVDDDEIILRLFKETLEELGHRVEIVNSGFKGLELVKLLDFDLIFLDLKMPGMDGATFLREIKSIKPELRVVIITGYPDSALMKRALDQAPFGVMNKPFGEADIITAISNFLLTSYQKLTYIK